MPGDLKKCYELTQKIFETSNLENCHMGTPGLFGRLVGAYSSLSAPQKAQYRDHIRKLVMPTENNYVVGGIAGVTASTVLPNVVGATIPGGIVGQVCCCLTVGFFASTVSQKPYFNKAQAKDEVPPTMPYLNIIYLLPGLDEGAEELFKAAWKAGSNAQSKELGKKMLQDILSEDVRSSPPTISNRKAK